MLSHTPPSVINQFYYPNSTLFSFTLSDWSSHRP